MATEQIYKLNVKPPNIMSLIVLSAFASMGAVLITPALPRLATFFNISNGNAQLTVTSFLLGYALGQLIYGPIANRLGRKPAFYIGIAIATLGSIFSIIASPVESFSLLVVGRFLEAFGSSVGLVVCLTIINDFYYSHQARKITSFMMFAFAIVPGVAVTVGGLLTEYLHWQSCFYFLLVYGLLLLYPSITLPETIIKYDPKALHSRYMLKNYWKMLRNKRLVAYAICYGCTAAINYVYSAEGPFIGINFLHFSPSMYGLLALIPFTGTALGSLICVKTANTFSANAILTFGIICEVLGALIMLLCFLLHLISSFSLFGPMFLILIGHACLCINCATLGIAQDEDKANASAVVNFLSVGMAVVFTLLLGILHSHSVFILPAMILTILVIMIFTYQLAREKTTKK
jgi:Bcr/CflA subfamily drug resistance transporter